MKKIEKPEVFNMLSFAISNSGIVSTSWRVAKEIYTLESDLTTHPDLNKKVEGVNKYLAEYYGIDLDNVTFKKVTQNEYETDDNGVSISITGGYVHPDSEQVTPLKTSAIQTHGTYYGFEKKLLKALKELTKEVEEYVFERKSNQMELQMTA